MRQDIALPYSNYDMGIMHKMPYHNWDELCTGNWRVVISLKTWLKFCWVRIYTIPGRGCASHQHTINLVALAQCFCIEILTEHMTWTGIAIALGTMLQPFQILVGLIYKNLRMWQFKVYLKIFCTTDHLLQREDGCNVCILPN